MRSGRVSIAQRRQPRRGGSSAAGASGPVPVPDRSVSVLLLSLVSTAVLVARYIFFASRA